MHIRLANADDAHSISALNADVQRIHANALPSLFKQPSSAVFPPSAARELLANPGNYIYVGKV